MFISSIGILTTACHAKQPTTTTVCHVNDEARRQLHATSTTRHEDDTSKMGHGDDGAQ